MRIYIAGKITGLDPDVVERNFEETAAWLTRRGHLALNPFELVDQTAGRSYEEYLADALAIMINAADAVYMLDNWADSKGARLEFYLARRLYKPIYHAIHQVPDVS